MKNKLIIVLLLLSVSVFARSYRTKTTTDIHEHKVTEHYLQKYDFRELTADSIAYIYCSPMRDKCFVPIIKPQFATVLSFFTKEHYKSGYGMNGFGTNGISNEELKALYLAIYENRPKDAKRIFFSIFCRINKNNCRVWFYGKDSWGRNTMYLYKVGFADRGIVLYYPDDFSCLIKSKTDMMKMWSKDPTRAGYNEFVRRFIELMIDYNKHITIEHGREHNEEIYILRFKEFKGVK